MRWAQFKRYNRDKKLIPITWTEFKAFLQKNIRESKSFVDRIWKKLKRDSQYQLEEVYDWASHLEHLQSILLKFDLVVAPTEVTMVKYFKKGLKPSIKVEIEQDNSQLIDYEELVAKAMKAEAKAGLRPSSYMQEINLSCLQGNWPAHIIAHKVQTQGAVKDYCRDDFKASKNSASTSVSTSTQDSNPSKKDKRKKYYQGKRDSKEPKDSLTSASGVNAAKVGGSR